MAYKVTSYDAIFDLAAEGDGQCTIAISKATLLFHVVHVLHGIEHTGRSLC